MGSSAQRGSARDFAGRPLLREPAFSCVRLPEPRLGRRDAGDAVTRGGPAGAGPGGGESRRRPEPSRVFPAPGSGRCKLHLADFLHPESIGFPSVVTPPPEGCLAFRPRPEAARGFVGVQAGPREPE
ncbi:LOW QUALITY PROTEIN: hypothetical protein U0070_011816, partial [Myodes glareolus]